VPVFCGLFFWFPTLVPTFRPQSRQLWGEVNEKTTRFQWGRDSLDVLDGLAKRALDGLQQADQRGLTLTLKVKYADFQSITRSVTFPQPISEIATVIDHLAHLLANTDAGAKKVRLLGVTVSNFLGAREDC
jgi:DNA polymerase-4